MPHICVESLLKMALERVYGDEQAVSATPETFIPSTPKIAAALELAKQAHEGQLRKTGEPFYYHPIAVAQIIESWGLGGDEDLIVAALLHDVPEDNENIGLDAVSEAFGPSVARLVDGVTKVDSQTSQDVDRDTLKKVSARSYLEPKVALVKIADRLHNMRTLSGMSSKKQTEKSTETLEIYAKLAQSLGLWSVKKELEDLSFMYLDSERFEQTKLEVDNDPRLDPNFLAHTTSSLENMLAEKDIRGRVAIRVNGYWGLYQKRELARMNGKTSASRGFSDINDLVSFRIVTEDLDSCYRALGLVHKQFGEYVDFGRYDEFIGVNRRINGYSAFQTTLNLPQGATEIAIATEEMERFNRKGVVSLLENGEINLEEYVLKSVFSDEGKIVFLPKNATGVDYAYSISPRLGANARAIMVDGEEKSLTTVVPNAATVDVVIGDPRRAPDPDYLNYCLPTTRAVITEQLNLAGTDELVYQGRQMAEDILASRGLLRFEDLGVYANELVFDYAKEDIRDIYLMLGSGAIAKEQVDKWLDGHSLTKEKLGITSIKLNGSDRSGILSDVTKWISDNGGNINGIDVKTENGKFSVLVVVDSLSQEGEQSIRDEVAEDERFENWKVV
jgi:(p)ppGpp synthase/HD superfamily hydrolase